MYTSTTRPSVRTAMIALTLLGMLAIAGCSSGASGTLSAKEERAMANFDLSKCQELQPNLFRCPAVDKPLCNPDFNDASVVCVKIGKKGELFQTIGTE